MYAGNPSPEALDLGTALQVIYDTLDLYTTDLQLARQNWLLALETFTPTSRDFPVSANNFAIPVRVEWLVYDGQTSTPITDDDYTDIPIIEHSELGNSHMDGTLACAFYGTPTRMALSFDPQGNTMRLWYETSIAQPQALTDSPKLLSTFHAMIKTRAALKLLPLVRDYDVDFTNRQTQVLLADLKRWERNFDLLRLEARNPTRTNKTAFNNSRKLINYW